MTARTLLFAIYFLLGFLWSDVASAETRVALVIGNASYKGGLSALANPLNDAKLIAKTLEKVGFHVIAVHDASQKEMKRAVAEFGKAIGAGGADVTSLFYYAGHGLQVGGTNYLVPVNAQIEHEADVDIESVAVDSILKQMEFSGAKTSIVILDACRNNPLARGFRSATRGLARMDAPNGSFIAYSTAPGDVAADGAGKNSPFASALAVEMVKPGQAIEETFRNVRIQVMADTAQKQTPWDSSSMILPFYFAGQKQPAVGMEPADTPATASQSVGSAGTLSSNEVGERGPEPVSAAPAAAALEADFVSPLPDGTIVLSHKVKEELDQYLARVAEMPVALGNLKWAFFYVSEDGRHSGTYFCRAELAEMGDCPRSEMNTGSTGLSRKRAQQDCEAKAQRPCVYLFRAENQKAEYQTLQ